MLEEIVGGFVSSWDIPKNAVIRKGLHGDLVFSILDAIYDTCYQCIQGECSINVNKHIIRRPINMAIYQFKLFGLLDDMDMLIADRINNPPVTDEVEKSIIEPYIDKIVPRYFKYNTSQIDCCRILDGTLGELNLLSASLGDQMLADSGVTLRTVKSRYIVIANEVTMLKSLIFKFKLINNMLYTIMQKLYKLGSKEQEPIEILEVDL